MTTPDFISDEEMKDFLSDEEMSAIEGSQAGPPGQQEDRGFMAGLTGEGQATGSFAMDALKAPFKAVGGLYNLAWESGKASNKYNNDPAYAGPLGNVAAGIQDVLFRGADTPGEKAVRAAELPASVVPGGRALVHRIGEATGAIDPKTGEEYGKMVREDLSYLPMQAAIAGTSYALNKRAALNPLKQAAEADALADPASQAALRYGESNGLLETQSAQKALGKGRVTQELSDVASQAQAEAKALQYSSTKDSLPGVAYGYPVSKTSAREFAAAQQMSEAGPVLTQSGVYNKGSQINPFTGQFEGGSPLPVSVPELIEKIEAASPAIISARKQVVSTLDQAMQTINRASPGEPKVRGIMFDTDVAPMVGELKEVIAKRAMLAQTAPMSEAMQIAYNKVQQSFGAIQNSNLLDRWNKIGPTGSFEAGELLPSEALSMIENMNAFRKSVGEFDEAARAGGLNSTHQDFAGRAAELHSLGQVQRAVQSALEGKAKEILSLAPGVRGYHAWQDMLPLIKEDTLPRMNASYGALQTQREAALTHLNTTEQGMTAASPSAQVQSVPQQQPFGVQVATGDKKGLIKTGIEKVFGSKEQNLPLEVRQKNLERLTSPNSQILDGLLLREKAVPIISRNWEKIVLNPDQMTELGNRAVMLGLVPQGMFDTLSDPMKRELHKAVVAAMPTMAESVAGGLNLIDGQYQNPMEKDAIVKQHLDSDALTRAMVIGASHVNKYLPPPKPQALPPMPPRALPSVMEKVSRWSKEPLSQLAPMATGSTDMLSQMEELTRNKLNHSQDRSG